jgi:2-oxoisovalerate ferredoxin oxidoreductase delta subunit
MSTEETPKPYPKINILECKACGRCVVACPKGVLKMGDKLNQRGYHYVEYSGEGCIGCGNCYYTCPEPSALEVHVPLKQKA